MSRSGEISVSVVTAGIGGLVVQVVVIYLSPVSTAVDGWAEPGLPTAMYSDVATDGPLGGGRPLALQFDRAWGRSSPRIPP